MVAAGGNVFAWQLRSTAGDARALGGLLRVALAIGLLGSITSIDTGPLLLRNRKIRRKPAPRKYRTDNTSDRVVIAATPASPGLAEYLARQSGVIALQSNGMRDRPPRFWARLIKNSHLADSGSFTPARVQALPSDAEIIVDASGAIALPCNHDVWRFETADGAPLFAPFTQSETWQRPPYVAHVRLVKYAGGSRQGTILAEACVGSRVPFRTLLNTLAEVAAAQLRGALTQEQDLSSARVTRLGPAHRGSIAGLAGGWVRYQARRWTHRLYSEFWCVGIVDRPLADVIRTGAVGDITWLDDGSRASYLADPFPLPGSGAILCEEYPYDTAVGRIIKLDPKTGARTPLDLCGSVTHRSYPYLWSEGGETYLLPESTEDRESILYKLQPDGTAVIAAVIGRGIRMADPTIFRASGFYWIAYADLDIAGGANLSLLYAQNLLGPWFPHARNPVKIDVRSSRPAGTPFQTDGVLYRPAQDCSRTYGWGVAINRVTEISTSRYTEVTERWFHPDRHSRFSDGMHTLTAAGNCTLIDGKRLTIRSNVLLRKVTRRLGLSRPELIDRDAAGLAPVYGVAALRADALDNGPVRPSTGIPA